MRIFTAAVLLSAAYIVSARGNDDEELANPANSPYRLAVNPADFASSTTIDNLFLPWTPGTVLVYEGGTERNEVEVLAETRTVLGIECVVVHDRVWDEGELAEETFDWYAQDNDGNVWYMGEDSRGMKGGEVTSTAGSWEAGVDGALPGIIMLAQPIPGLWYRTEYFEGEAEDLAQILALGQTVIVPAGTYAGCIQTLEYSALEPGVEEHKYYAPGVGVVKEVTVRGGSEGNELVEIRRGG